MTSAKPTRVELERADVYADESKQLLIDRASATLDREYRKAVKAWLIQAKHYFPAGHNRRWNLKHIRTNQVPIRHATEQLAEQIAGIYMQVSRQARRLAFAKAFRVSSGLQDELLGKTPDARVALAKVAKMTEAERQPSLYFHMLNDIRFREGSPAELDTSQKRVARTLVISGDSLYVLIWPNGTVQLPGGKLEPGETFERAAIRETKEEAGIDVSITGWLCDLNDKHAVRKFYLAAVVPKMQESLHIDPDGNLLVDVRTFPVNEAAEMMTSPYDRAAVGTYLANRSSMQESDFDPTRHPRVPAGSPGGGEFGVGGGVTVKAVSTRAYSGKTVETKSRLTHGQVGALGEQIAIAYLKQQGFKDAAKYEADGRNNLPVDLINDHEVTEVKAGLVSNGASAQQWRMTIGEPGPAEKAWLAKAGDKAKADWNARKQAMIADRKAAAIKELSKQLGRRVKGRTLTVIINPDTKTADIHVFEGFHQRIGWNSQQAKDGYRGTVKYG